MKTEQEIQNTLTELRDRFAEEMQTLGSDGKIDAGLFLLRNAVSEQAEQGYMTAAAFNLTPGGHIQMLIEALAKAVMEQDDLVTTLEFAIQHLVTLTGGEVASLNIEEVQS